MARVTKARKPIPVATPAERVSASRARALDGGAKRVEVILRDQVAIAALDGLCAEHGNATAAITHALKGSRRRAA